MKNQGKTAEETINNPGTGSGTLYCQLGRYYAKDKHLKKEPIKLSNSLKETQISYPFP